MPKPTDSKTSTALTAVVYAAIVLFAVLGIGLILLLPERSTAVGLVYQGF